MSLWCKVSSVDNIAHRTSEILARHSSTRQDPNGYTDVLEVRQAILYRVIMSINRWY